MVITIIVLLILVGVTLSTLSGQDGILNKAATAADRTNKEAIKEKAQIQVYGSYNTEGKLDMDELSTNIRNNFGKDLKEEPKYNGAYDEGVDEKLRGCLTFKVGEYNVRIDGQGNVILYKNGEAIGFPSNADGTRIGKAGEMIPVIKDSTAKRVYWKDNGDEVVEGKDGSKEFNEDEWCDYGSKKWANVQLADGSYFVWIPRFAYKINNTVRNQTPGDNVAGTIDVRFVGTDVTTENIAEKLGDDYDDYIVHPAFCDESKNGYENGGWDSELPGIWVAKYEMSMENSKKPVVTTENGETRGDVETDANIKAVSKPDVSSWRYITVGKCYTNGKNYDSNKESHLMKNSEWGAVAYLTHSNYGRSGEEVSVNQSHKYITGAGKGKGDKVYNSTYEEPEEDQRYNGEIGKLSSTTENISGIYDLSGGGWEYVAVFRGSDTFDYDAQGGSSFAGVTKTNTKWATKYESTEGTPTGEKSKEGDAIWDIYVSNNKGWFGDYSEFAVEIKPFAYRGGHCNDAANAGMFAISSAGGTAWEQRTFRVVLMNV